ncbi:MAG: TolC family protein, partial [Muribaculaceae bacterium]|nr:TolC family protein [Muribaculaceae bacterium]
MKRTPTILISLLLAIPMQAQMTLNDCLVYAREHAHSNRINRMEVEVAAANKRIGVADMLPYVALGANGSLSFGRNIDPETNTYDNKKTLGTGFGIDLSLPLFDGLVRINNVKALKAAELRKKQSRLVEEDRISLEVIKDFYNVSYCRAMVEQMDRQLRRDSTDLLATERGEELGTKSGADVAELKA